MHGWGARHRLNSLGLLIMLAMLPVGAQGRIHPSKAIKRITGIYQGEVGGRKMVLEIGAADRSQTDLAVPGDESLPVIGRYFYRDEGVAFPLHGRFQKDGHLHLRAYYGEFASGAKFVLRFRDGRVRGFSCIRADDPAPRLPEMLRVSLRRISKKFDPRPSPALGVEFGSPQLDKAYYDLLLDYPLTRTHAMQISRDITYVMVSDPRFNISFPLLTRFPDAKVMKKVNQKLMRALQEDRLEAANCRFTGSLAIGTCRWKAEEGHIALITRSILSITREIFKDDGPFDSSSVGTKPLLLNLRSGDYFYWQDFFQMRPRRRYALGDRDGFAISGTELEILLRLYDAHTSSRPTICEKYPRPSLSAYFDQQGLVIMGSVSGVEMECSREIIIPYSELSPWVAQDSPFRDLVDVQKMSPLLAAPGWPQPSAKKFNDSGLTFYEKDHYDAAIHEYSEAIRLSPDYAEAFKNRGNAYHAKGDYSHAIEDYTQALRLQPGYVGTLLERGLSYDNQGNYEQAIQDYTEAIRLDSNYGEAFFQRGSDYRLLGDQFKAHKDIEQALALIGDDGDRLETTGNRYSGRHDYNHALRVFDEVIRRHPSHKLAFAQRGMIYFEQGDYDRAIADYTQAGDVLARGRAYRKKGDYDHAIEDFSEALGQYPDYAFGHQERCELYLLKADYKLAIDDCTQALQLNKKCHNCLSTDPYFSRGVARLYVADAERAYEDFSHTESPFATIWDYLAKARTDKDAGKRLKEHSPGAVSGFWPDPLFGLFFDESTPEEALGSAGNNEERICEADLYVGEFYTMHGNQTEAQRLFLKATDHCSEKLFEFQIARAELRRLNQF